MSGETDLAKLLRDMRPTLRPGIFVFATLPPALELPAGIAPIMTFREDEGLTLILTSADAEAAKLAGTFPSRMITLEVRSSLAAVGLLAAITARLAEAGIAVNAVSAFHHDHLFVPANRAEEALGLLERLARS